ncbi:MAG: hypothetical protein ACC661_04515 [Verrucomicrobiales bacterium]
MALPSGLPESVGDDETLARFVLASKHFSQPQEGHWRVKYPAFIPDPHDDLSVSRVEGLPSDSIAKLGRPVAAKQRKALYGAALVKCGLIRRQSLDILADEPPERHANIVGWPKESDRKEQKSRRQLIALELAESSRFIEIDA